MAQWKRSRFTFYWSGVRIPHRPPNFGENMNRDEAFLKSTETDGYNKLLFVGPQTAEELVAALIIQMYTFFLYTGTQTYKPVYDVLEPHLKDIQERAYQKYSEKLYGETLKEAIQHKPFTVVDGLHQRIAQAAYRHGEIKELVGEELYNQAVNGVDEAELTEWSKYRKNPLVDACIAATSNCMCGVKND